MRLIIVAFWTILALKLSASAPTDTFQMANEAFERGAINDAIQLYENIVDNHYHSTAIYHNLGLAYLKQENWSAARYYLEKGLLEAPLDAGLKRNLQYVREQVDDPYNFPAFPLTGLIVKIHHYAGRNLIAVGLLIVFLGILAIVWLKPMSWQMYSYFLGALWMILLGLFLLERNYDRTNHEMAIIWSEADVYEKPDELSGPVTSLKNGYKVHILEEVGSWYHIDLADGTTGWMEENNLRRL